jgi:hypothetical protein
MPRRKTYPIPAIPSYQLHRYLRLARKAAWELSESPYFRSYPDTVDAFMKIYQAIANAQRLHGEQSEIVLVAGRRQ